LFAQFGTIKLYNVYIQFSAGSCLHSLAQLGQNLALPSGIGQPLVPLNPAPSSTPTSNASKKAPKSNSSTKRHTEKLGAFQSR